MPTTGTREQERWNEITSDPQLRELSFKVETNARGQIILSPHSNAHSKRQRAVEKLLAERAPEGEVYPEFAIATSEGVKVPDVVWSSPERERAMNETGDPTTLAPEICVEILSESDRLEALVEKASIYRQAGADEVWILDQNGRLHFYRDEEVGRSDLVPDCPERLSPG